MRNISLAQAEAIITLARKLTEEREERAAFAIVDNGGNLVTFARMDGANLITIETALGKAYTALTMNVDTRDLNPYIQPGQFLFGTGLILQQLRSLVPYAGGILLRNNSHILGALGVSGAATSDTDHEIAQAAQTALVNDII